MYSNVQHDALGDLRCPGVDVEAWQKANRIPLYRGVNTWVMAYSGDPGDFDSYMRKGLSDWMSGSGGVADLYTVVESFNERQPVELAANAVASYTKDLQQQFFLSSANPIRYYKISFRWQSANDQQVNIAWPVYNAGTLSSSGCITDATVGVFYVLTPQQLQTAEEVNKMISDLNKGLNVPATTAASTSINLPPATQTPWYLTWWAIAGGALAVGTGVFMFRGKRARRA
jgi:hypothetical protein